MKGKTSSGFEYELDEAALDDYELLEDLCEMDEGDMTKTISVLNPSSWNRTERTFERTFTNGERKGTGVENDE